MDELKYSPGRLHERLLSLHGDLPASPCSSEMPEVWNLDDRQTR